MKCRIKFVTVKEEGVGVLRSDHDRENHFFNSINKVFQKVLNTPLMNKNKGHMSDHQIDFHMLKLFLKNKLLNWQKDLIIKMLSITFKIHQEASYGIYKKYTTVIKA